MKLLSNIGARVAEAYAYRHEPEHLRVLAESYWRALLCVVALIVVSSILFGALQLFSVLGTSDDTEAIKPLPAKETTLDRTQLQTTLDGFEARQTNYLFLKAHPKKIADPK